MVRCQVSDSCMFFAEPLSRPSFSYIFTGNLRMVYGKDDFCSQRAADRRGVS